MPDSWDIDIDYTKMEIDEAKNLVHYIVSYTVLMGMSCGICIYLSISGCCLVAIKKAKRGQKQAERMEIVRKGKVTMEQIV